MSAWAKPPRFSEYCPARDVNEDDWQTGTPAAHRLEQATIDKLIRDARGGKLGKVHSVLVVKDGKLVVEEYFRGATRNHCQLIASVI